MLEDVLLVRRVKRGDGGALRRIYVKYGDGLLSVAFGLLGNIGACEDIVHDVFLSFVERIDEFELTGSLKAYLATCVANRAKDRLRAKKNRTVRFVNIETVSGKTAGSEEIAATEEQLQLLSKALQRLPFEQREVIMLRLQGGMRFREISALKEVSINTVQGRYRYGIKKLRSFLNSEEKK